MPRGVCKIIPDTQVDIWKFVKDKNADESYDMGLRMYGGIYAGTDVMKANCLTKICEGMSASYEEIIDDQNDYQMEIDAQLDEIEKLKLELEQKVKEREAEKEKLVKAAGEDGLSDEDVAKCNTLDYEISAFTNETNTAIAGINNKISTAANGAKSDLNKAEIATDYGETALEKGEPLANMQDKRKSFWRKAFGGWDKSQEREAGNKLMDAGNTLLEQVQTSSDIEKAISKKNPKKTV